MLKQGLSQKMLQKMSPQQIQLMKLLQVPTAQLEQRIKEELEANPALEEGEALDGDEKEEAVSEEAQPSQDEKDEAETSQEEEIDLSEYMNDDEIADYKLQDNNYPDPDEEKTVPIPVEKSFHEYLLDQLGALDLDERQEKIAEQLIGSIDNDGYLKREISSVIDDLSFSQNISATEAEVLEVLKKVQELDPPGTGARNLQECLLLQIDRIKGHEIYTRLAKKILTEHYDLFIKKHYDKLQKILEIPEEHLKGGLDIILHLNPKPGSGYSSGAKSEQYITPDFFITNNNGELQLSLNGRNAPELRISREFREMMKDYDKSKNKTKEQKEAVMFIKQKIDSAKWFIDAIRQRQKTLLDTMQAILEYQYEFFSTGDETKLKPMILKDIADKTGLDISTVSRVSNSKYVQTEFGIFPLKYFFSESIQTDTGEEVSTREVKKILTDMIAIEDKKKPYSDQYLTKMLNQRGYNIARRTVAKYREQLDIPVARLR
ncbi:MAG TPA: RNA polymerase factor sigma-54, partial [Chitinophagales bacterium]|nr:RNA polymerase factor sigma-54 [Chitinophagales bacterium]